MSLRSKVLLGVGFIVAVAVLLILLISVVEYSESRVSPRQVTTTRMYLIRTRVFSYIKAHGTWPESLVQLTNSDGKHDSNMDAWGREIIYLVDSNGVVTLKSYGGVSHRGEGSDKQEIIESFPTRDSSGNWRKGMGSEY